MDICTIVEFREALLRPELSFATLKRVSAHTEAITRTQHFAECRATIAGRSAMIYAPISPKAAEIARRAIETLRGIESRALTPIEILESEMACGVNGERRCMIVVEYPLRGTTLAKAQYTLTDTTLNRGIERFESELKSNNISHNNLSLDNILVDNTSVWHCIRQYYFTQGSGGDMKALESIRESITQCGISTSTLNEPMSTYAIDPLCENRVQIKEGDLVGFADQAGNKVIECKYLWASDFAEQRALVATPQRRMGLIDNFGNEIIPAIYDEVIYDVKTGHSEVTLSGQRAEFDYLGVQLSEFRDID